MGDFCHGLLLPWLIVVMGERNLVGCRRVRAVNVVHRLQNSPLIEEPLKIAREYQLLWIRVDYQLQCSLDAHAPATLIGWK